MRLVKVNSLPPELIVGPQGPPGPQGPQGPMGPPGRDGKDGRDGITKTITEVVEKVDLESLTLVKEELAKLKKQFDWLKNQPQSQGGGQAVTQYLWTDKQETHYRKPSFIEGITVIGVRYDGPATVYLPHDLDPTMLVTVKDEVGSGNITVLVE